MSMRRWGHSAFSALPKKQNVPNSQRGSVLLPVVVAIVLLAAVTFMLSYGSVSETTQTSGELERDRLRYVTEAGLAHARLQLSRKSSCNDYGELPETDFAGDSYSASISPSAGSPVTVLVTGKLQNGITQTASYTPILAYEAPTTVVLQLSKDTGKDVMIDDFYPNANYGSIDDITVRSGSWIQRPLIEFDLSGIPAGVNIVSATLDLELRTVSTPGVVGVHRMTRSWVEGTGKGTGNADGATWNDYDGDDPWSQPGGDFDPTLYGTAAVSSAKNGQRVTWDIRDLVDGWVSGRFPNYGLMLADDGVVNNAEFQSREEPDPMAAPRLTIVYACECGKSCGGAPPAGKNVLLVVGDATTLDGKDQDRKTLFESWSHTVTLIDDGDSQSNFDAAAAANDVVYVSGTIGGGALADKLTGSPTPIVNEFNGKLDNFGFSSGTSATTSSSAFSTTNAAHYITLPFSGGATTVFNSALTMPVPGGTLAPDLQTVGDVSGTPALVTLDVGAQRWDGSPAPARRAHLPFSAAEVAQLTADGETLIERAIEWGAGAGAAAAPGYNILLIVGDDTTLASKDVGYKALMESWGHTVAVIDDGASQADYDTAMGAADVIYASGSALGANILNKPTYTTKGLVNEVSGKIDNFGFSSSTSATANFDTFSATDGSHYITEPFSGGSVTVFTSSLTNPVPGGTLAPDLQNVGQVSTTLVLGTLDAGATRYDGNPSQGRRAHLPFASAETTDMTADGKTILQRAIEWAAGLESAALGPIAHWKLDETSGTTAVDSEGGHNGTLTNMTESNWGTGQIDGGLDFPGNDDYVNVPHDDALSLTDMTISVWLNTPTLNNVFQTMVRKKQQANYQLTTWSDEVVFAFSDGSGMILFQTTGANLSTNVWHHVVATLDDTTGDINIYVDGTPVYSTTTTHHPLPNTEPLTIGGVPDSSTVWPGMLDDIRLYNSVLTAAEVADLYAAGSGGGGGPGGGSCDGNFRDNFNARAWNGSNGSLSWATDWLEVGESGGPTSGDIQVMNDQSNYQLRTRDNDNGGEGAEREADLSGAASATLNYDYRRMNLDGSSDYTSVEISANGASGPWTELTRHAGSGNDSSYQPASHPITPHISANTRIRFKTSSTMGATDTVWFDNVEIVCTP